MRINTKKELITKLLTRYPHLRDDDNKLIATIWRDEVKYIPPRSDAHTALDFLQLYADKRLTNAESIRRCRAKIQEVTPELRGIKYNARHESTEQTIDELYNWA